MVLLQVYFVYSYIINFDPEFTIKFYRDECSNLLSNQQFYKELCIRKDLEIPEGVKSRMLVDPDFIKQVEREVRIQDPICRIIREAEKKTCTLGEIIGYWLKLRQDLPTVLPSNQEDLINKRLQMVLTPLSLTAFYLNPRSDRKLLKPEHRSEINAFVMKYFRNKSNKSINDYVSFQEKQGMFGEYMERNLNARAYWKLLEPTYPELSELALKVSVIPASSSQLERIFYNWSTIHTKLRNRLTSESSKKLIHIYYSYMSTLPVPEEIDGENEPRTVIDQQLEEITDIIDSEEENEPFELEDIDVSDSDSDSEALLELAIANLRRPV